MQANQPNGTIAGRRVIRTYHYEKGGNLIKVSYEDFDNTLAKLAELAATISPLDESLLTISDDAPCACCNSYPQDN